MDPIGSLDVRAFWRNARRADPYRRGACALAGGDRPLQAWLIAQAASGGRCTFARGGRPPPILRSSPRKRWRRVLPLAEPRAGLRRRRSKVRSALANGALVGRLRLARHFSRRWRGLRRGERHADSRSPRSISSNDRRIPPSVLSQPACIDARSAAPATCAISETSSPACGQTIAQHRMRCADPTAPLGLQLATPHRHAFG